MERLVEPHARDLMQRDIITVTPETPILDVHGLFVEEELHGAAEAGDDRVKEATAGDAMTKELVTRKPTASVEHIARTMLAHHVHRVLVIGAERELEGVITT